jgi:hypothetical protein
MQLLPGPRTRSAFTALKREQQAVESIYEGFNRPAIHYAVGIIDVVDLVGIVLASLVFVCICKGCSKEKTYSHVIKFMFIRAPYRVRKVITISNDPHVLVRVVRKVGLPKERISFYQILTPELNVDMLTLLVGGQQLFSDGDWFPVEVFA